MDDMKDYTTNELQAEVERRMQDELEENAKALPKDFLPYKAVTEINHDNDSSTRHDHQFFIAHVDDGAEGYSYLVQYDHPTFGHADDEDQLILDTVKHSFLSSLGNTSDLYLDGVTMQELGREYIEFIKIDGTKRKEEDDY